MIRAAGPADCGEIARLGRQFHAEAGWNKVAEYIEADCARSIELMLDHGIVLVAEVGGEIVGFAGGMIFPLYFNHGHQTGSEMFLWVKPEHRGSIGAQLLTEMENAAALRGNASFGMALMADLSPERTERLYLRRGYVPHERTYLKVF